MIGRTLGHYRVLEKLGEGGMGEVYRAQDEVLGREVAIKVLPAAFTEDPERLARFEREAKVLAALNHPHIAAIYGLEEDDGQRFLVLELVEGETLAERLLRGPLPVAEAVLLAIQMARALEAAHEKGVVHRDLKPANVKITPEGEVKVLDFGLAKPSEATFEGDLAESPTLTYAPTGQGVLMGTAAYMSPEQVRGRAVDKRSDIWAFGVVLWEMLTGRKLFGGDTVSDVLASTLLREPDWEGLPADLPMAVKRILRHCLVQDPKDRLHDIADARIELEEAQEGAAEEVVPAPIPRPLWQRALPWLAVPLALLVGWLLRPAPEPEPTPTVKFEVPLPEGERLTHSFRRGLDLSPDGRSLAFASGTLLSDLPFFTERSQIHLRQLDRRDSEPIPGTERSTQPVFSPDGDSLAFLSVTPDFTMLLRRVSLEGGEAETICECDASFGADWGTDDRIVFAGQYTGLRQVAAQGGTPVALTELNTDRFETSHRLPHWLPGGETLLFTTLRFFSWRLDHALMVEIRAYSLQSGEQKTLIEDGADARYLPSGHLVFARRGRLMAVPFDVERLEVLGPEIPLVEDINQSVFVSFGSPYNTLAAQFSVSSTGTLAMALGGGLSEVPRELLLVDRSGRVEPMALEPRAYSRPRVAQDGRRLIVETLAPPWDVWSIDRERDLVARQSYGGSVCFIAVGPGPDEVTFPVVREDRHQIAIKTLDTGPGDETILETDIPHFKAPSSWSPDGQHLAVVTMSLAGGPQEPTAIDIWIVNRNGTARPFLDSEFREEYPEFSPDGNWLLFMSDESGREEVYVRAFPGPGAALRISTDGGASPSWSPDGREIVYRWDGDFYAVEIGTSLDGLLIGQPKKLFQDDYIVWTQTRAYDVLADGRFVVTANLPDQEREAAERFYPTTIQIVQNWFAELEEKLPSGR